MAAPGTSLGPYELLGSIGAGGMGEIYRARDPRLSREVAIKILPAQFATDPERLRRFEQEARAVAALSHPNILAVFDIGAQANGSPYIVTTCPESLALTMLQPGAAESPARIALKTCCMARMAEWVGSGDRLLSILESQEAKSVAKLLGHDVEQQISVYLRRCQQVARKPN